MDDLTFAALPDDSRRKLLAAAKGEPPPWPRCESGWTGDRCQLPLYHEGDHDNDSDRLQLSYQIADEARSIESAGQHYSISELIFESELPDSELRVLLRDLKDARKIIETGRIIHD